MSPDNCCAGCCGHYRDRNTGSNAESAVENWIRTCKSDLAACIGWRQTDAVHQLLKRGINVEILGVVFARHDDPPVGSAEMPARCHPSCPLMRGLYQHCLIENSLKLVEHDAGCDARAFTVPTFDGELHGRSFQIGRKNSRSSR